jgi:hypothetical protein
VDRSNRRCYCRVAPGSSFVRLVSLFVRLGRGVAQRNEKSDRDEQREKVGMWALATMQSENSAWSPA